RRALLEIGPEPLADTRRQNAVEILQRRTLQLLIVGLQAAEGDLERLTGQDQRQQREDVRQTRARTVAHELVERRQRLGARDAVEQAPAFPHRPADAGLALHDVEDTACVDDDG